MKYTLTAKKSLGQHFLKDEKIADKIASSLINLANYTDILEIGPGMGILTKYLLKLKNHRIFAIEKDREAYEYILRNLKIDKENLILSDFLECDLDEIFPMHFAVIGNFPYNISSQILFRVLDYRNRIPEVVGMFQKEVAERIASQPNKKTYGIISVLLQAYYNIEYLFTVNEDVFMPPPKVKSAVLRLTRNKTAFLACNEDIFTEIVKTAFNQRRKMLGNALKPLGKKINKIDVQMLSKRAENLSVDDFVKITNILCEQ